MNKLTNLLVETKECLADHDKSLSDVKFISGGGYEIPVEDFICAASMLEYDNGYGRRYIPDDLIIMGDGWWLEREEYDGLEWWQFRTTPKRPGTRRHLVLFGEGYGWLNATRL